MKKEWGYESNYIRFDDEKAERLPTINTMTIAETAATANRYGKITGLGEAKPMEVAMFAKKNPAMQSSVISRIEKYMKLNLCALVLPCNISKNPPSAAICTAKTKTAIYIEASVAKSAFVFVKYPTVQRIMIDKIKEQKALINDVEG